MIKEKDLYNQNVPIGRSSPIGKAIMALTIYNRSQDWVTEEPLTVSQVRQLVVILRNRCEVKRPSQGEPYGLSYPAL